MVYIYDLVRRYLFKPKIFYREAYKLYLVATEY